jgi:hypothetical protein
VSGVVPISDHRALASAIAELMDAPSAELQTLAISARNRISYSFSNHSPAPKTGAIAA